MDFDDHDESDDVDLPAAAFPSPPPPPPPSALPKPPAGRPAGARYRECLKNHAVGIGGHAVDGCGEFMPAGEEGTLDALKCAACSCHRNFHRRDPDHSGSAAANLGLLSLNPEHPHSPSPFHHHFPSPSSTSYYHHHHHRSPVAYLHHPFPHRPPPPLALPSTSGGRDDDDLSGDPPGPYSLASSSGKKRFRTKFTQDQKEKMLALAERLGWRIQKHDEALVQQFCAESGVKRHVLKVWMHNNKHTLGKKP